jgi:predicted permease
MHEYLQILGGVIPIFLVMGLGAVIRRFGILNEQADRTLLDVCVHVLLPCLILDHLVANPALRHWENLLWSPLLGFLLTSAGIGVAALVARFWFKADAQRRTFVFVGGIYNYGYIPVPLIATLYGADALGVLFLYNLGTEAAFWIVGFTTFMGHSIRRDWRRAFTSPVRAILLGVTINLVTAAFGLRLDAATLDAHHLWGWPVKVILSAVNLIGVCSIPLATLIIGATMADFWGEFRETRGIVVMGLALAVRNLVCPLGFILVAALLPVSQELKETLIVQAAMPAGVFTLLLTRHNGGSVPVALQIIFSTTVAAIVTLPLWIHLGMRFVFAH